MSNVRMLGYSVGRPDGIKCSGGAPRPNEQSALRQRPVSGSELGVTAWVGEVAFDY